jgi:hypothetical protein
MMPSLKLKYENESSVFDELRSGHFAFLSVLSFESRCTAVAAILRRQQSLPFSAFVVSYQTEAVPKDIDSILREKHTKEMAALMTFTKFDCCKPISPYSSNILREQMINLLHNWTGMNLVIDITCMTRVHLFVLSSMIANGEIDWKKVVFAYTGPQSYNVDGNKALGWRDTILIPIGKNRSFRREGHARGLALAGHDGERLSIALSELEPASGLLVFANTPRRPDFLQRSREANHSIAQRLLTLRMPRDSSTAIHDSLDGWIETIVNINDFDKITKELIGQIQGAIKDEGPIILFPVGPKSLTFASAILLASTSGLDSWAVYPIPDGYSVNYSTGNSKTFFMKVIPFLA